jgi:hypothetical protein
MSCLNISFSLQIIFFKIYFWFIMSVEILFFTGAGLIALLTILLGISNWVFLSSISTKISGLEDEIEKKTSELESLKKDRLATGGAQAKGNQQSMAKIAQAEYSDSGSQQIEIVRNIRGGGFENYDAQADHAPGAGEEPLQMQASGAAGNAPEQQSDVLDVVDEGTAAQRQDIITLSLFSNAKKDTDFAAAWKRLSEVLQNVSSPRIEIDFGNVMFLYDRELSYLEKFLTVVLQAGGTITFVNCEAELSATLRNNPRLGPYVDGRSIGRENS